MPFRSFNKRKRFGVYGRKVRPRMARNAFLARRGKLLRYGRFAGRLSKAALAYEVGSMAYRAAKSRFSHRNIGEPPGTGTAKRCATLDRDIVTEDTRTLYTHNLVTIQEGTAIDERMRRIVNIRGFHICAELRNRSTAPMYMNVAILATKGGTESSSVGVSDFFRASVGGNRARDFANDLTGMEFHCLPINTDRYTILRHKRFRFIEDGGTTYNSQSGRDYTNINWYVRLNRQLRYDSNTGTPESGNVYLVYWADLFETNSGTAPITGAFSNSWRVVTTFREPRND